MLELCKTVGKLEIPPNQKYIVLEILVEDENGDEPDVPSKPMNIFMQ